MSEAVTNNQDKSSAPAAIGADDGNPKEAGSERIAVTRDEGDKETSRRSRGEKGRHDVEQKEDQDDVGSPRKPTASSNGLERPRKSMVLPADILAQLKETKEMLILERQERDRQYLEMKRNLERRERDQQHSEIIRSLEQIMVEFRSMKSLLNTDNRGRDRRGSTAHSSGYPRRSSRRSRSRSKSKSRSRSRRSRRSTSGRSDEEVIIRRLSDPDSSSVTATKPGSPFSIRQQRLEAQAIREQLVADRIVAEQIAAERLAARKAAGGDEDVIVEEVEDEDEEGIDVVEEVRTRRRRRSRTSNSPMRRRGYAKGETVEVRAVRDPVPLPTEIVEEAMEELRASPRRRLLKAVPIFGGKDNLKR